MAKADAQKFLEKLDSDAGMRSQVRQKTDQISQLAKQHGFNFTTDELGEALRDKWGARQAERGSADPHTCFSEAPGA